MDGEDIPSPMALLGFMGGYIQKNYHQIIEVVDKQYPLARTGTQIEYVCVHVYICIYKYIQTERYKPAETVK